MLPEDVELVMTEIWKDSVSNYFLGATRMESYDTTYNRDSETDSGVPNESTQRASNELDTRIDVATENENRRSQNQGVEQQVKQRS